MAQFIDRRPHGKNKSAVNRQRFLKRYKNQIKQFVNSAIKKRNITDITGSEKIIIPAKDIVEPSFQHGIGGKRELVHPGNKEFFAGDKIPKPPTGNAASGTETQATNTGEGMDDFEFELTKEEFLDMFFDDLALPDLVKTHINKIPSVKWIRAGYTKQGSPANLSISQSFKKAFGRRIALGGKPQKRIEEIDHELEKLHSSKEGNDVIIEKLEKEKLELQAKIQSIRFLDPLDLRYKLHEKRPYPTTQAVMFCLMDVSGSMDEVKKDLAKRFFILLYLFLTHSYEKIDIVFIRHHTTAKEVDEKEFFHSRETGGTVVSSALELMKKIIQSRYSSEDWNIYGAQASDGDNWMADSPYCHELLLNQIMPYLQYYAYVEIKPRTHQSLWEAYLTIKECCPNFAMTSLNNYADIYPVLHELFQRQIT